MTILVIVIAIMALSTYGIWRVKYAPTSERMSIKTYYGISGDEAALFINGKQVKGTDEEPVAMAANGTFYITLEEVKTGLDDGYVYDETGQVLRYTTDDEVISVNRGDTFYTSGRNREDLGSQIVTEDSSDNVYLSVDFIKKFTDVVTRTAVDPNRIVVEKAGFKKKTAEIRKDTQARRYGGPKSRILADVTKGTKVTIEESYGKWSKILTDDGLEGCVKDSCLTKTDTEKTKRSLPQRKYNHIKLDGKVCLLWHQVMNRTANSSIDRILTQVSGVNVISPTWFRLADNDGGISDIASQNYVNTVHDAGLQVWALVSNFENKDVDTTTVLNSVSSRDNLINNLIGKAVSYDLDGINVDFEQISTDAADGYSEFIKELSLKCENNDLVLSVDNYAPTASSDHYNRTMQADYADYCIVMAYDEHYSSKNPGSNASLPFVKKAVADSLKEIPAEQLVLGMPFYAKIWTTKDNVTTMKTIAMKNISAWLDSHNVQETWDDELGQNYAEFSEDGAKVTFWSEDAKSLGLKLNVMKTQKLAGGAFWKEGLEDDSVWDLIGKYMR